MDPRKNRQEIQLFVKKKNFCLGVTSTSNLLSCDESESSLVGETPGRGFMTTAFLLEDLSLGR